MCKILAVSLAVCLPLVFGAAVPFGDFDTRNHLAHLRSLRSNSNLSPRIVGGVEVTPHSYPSQAALFFYAGEDPYLCGGTLVSKRWVLTSAYCVTVKHDYILVVLGDHDLNDFNPPVVILNSTSYHRHEYYKRENPYENDVALVELPREVTFTDNIQPAVLAKGSERYDGDDGTALGWGKTETEDMSPVLKKVDLTIITNDACAAASDNFHTIIKSTHMCTSGEGNVGICSLDNGGPLFVDDVQVGIISFGMVNCSQGLPSVFTRVNDYYDWIMNIIGEDTDTTVTPSTAVTTSTSVTPSTIPPTYPTTGAPGKAASFNSLKLGAIVLIALYFVLLLK